MPRMLAEYKKWASHGLFAVTVFITAVISANYLATSAVVKHTVASFGYIGIFVVSIISGMNLIVPVHAASFTPLFLSAGFPAPAVIAAMALGISVSDLAAYWVAHLGKHFAYDRYAEYIDRFEKMSETWHLGPMAILFVYAIIAPIPNELLLIPYAIIGIPLQKVVGPLFLGNIIHITLFVYGISLFS